MKDIWQPFRPEGPGDNQRRKWREAYWRRHEQKLAALKKYYRAHRQELLTKKKEYEAKHRAHYNWLRRLSHARRRQRKILYPGLSFNFYGKETC